MKIHIIATALPSNLDGIGDNPDLLAAEMARSAVVKVLTAQNDSNTIPGVAVESVFAANPLVWMLQYNPNSYGREGRNLPLIIARAIVRFHSDLPQRSAMGKGAQKTASRLTWSHFGENTKRTYVDGLSKLGENC